MGFFSKAKKSLKKSNRHQALQKLIAPPEKPSSDSVADMVSQIRSGEIFGNSAESKKYLEEYLDLCETDEEIREIMAETGLTRENLRKLYQSLTAIGDGMGKGPLHPAFYYRLP